MSVFNFDQLNLSFLFDLEKQFVDFFTKKASFYPKSQEVITSYQIKCETYQQAGFHVKPRENKVAGFEGVRRYYDLYKWRILWKCF